MQVAWLSLEVSPLFRSVTQFRVLGELFLRPGVATTISELADRVGSSVSTISREVDRLRDSGIVADRREGNQRLVTARLDTPISEDLRRLLVKTYGPAPMLAAMLEPVAGLEEARVFGSWAARATGSPGPIPGDIDLLVIGDVDHLEIYDLARRATSEIGLEVNPVIRTRPEWETETTGFAETVRSSPSIDVTPRRAADD